MTGLAPLAVALDAKPFVALAAMVLLVALERAAPATREGRATLKHDAVNLALGGLNAVIGVLLALWALPRLPTEGAGVLGAVGARGATATVAAIVLLDLWMYAWHRASHTAPLLWRLHRTHHSDPAMDATTAVRFHPLEPALSHALRIPVAIGLGIGAGHVVLYEALLLPIIILHHSNVRLPTVVDRALSFLIVTPNLHRSHHSPAPECRNRNFGSVFSFWDRLFGSLIPTCSAVGHRFGLDGLRRSGWQGLPGLLATPFRRDDVSAGGPA